MQLGFCEFDSALEATLLHDLLFLLTFLAISKEGECLLLIGMCSCPGLVWVVY